VVAEKTRTPTLDSYRCEESTTRVSPPTPAADGLTAAVASMTPKSEEASPPRAEEGGDGGSGRPPWTKRKPRLKPSERTTLHAVSPPNAGG
jgi:hypothetical protein